MSENNKKNNNDKGSNQQKQPSYYSMKAVNPDFPIPKLSVTFSKWLNSIVPFCLAQPDKFDLRRSQQDVIEFLTSKEAAMLQNTLISHAKNEREQGRSYLEDYWFKWAYLIWRVPLAISSNIAMCGDRNLLEISNGVLPEQCFQAARIVDAFCRWKAQFWDPDRILAEKMKSGSGKEINLCNWQYAKLFTCARIPKKGCDVLQHAPCSDQITVICNGRIYFMKPLNKSLAQIYSTFKWIVDQATSKPAEPGFGICTASNRDKWAEIREDLEQNSANQKILQNIDRSLFVVSLDQSTPANTAELLPIILAGNANDRWFDKIFQLIVCKSGHVGLNGEHTPLDAVAVGVVMDWALEYMYNSRASQISQEYLEPLLDLPVAAELKMYNQNNILRGLAVEWEQYSGNLQTAELNFTEYGSTWIKSQKFSPDAYVQMALQLAYYRTYGRPCATYETAQTRQFFHGRTETTRSCSLDSLNWTKGMESPDVPRERKIELLRIACQSHINYISAAANGKGCDRHLLMLRIFTEEALQRKQMEKKPKLFSNPVLAHSTHFNLSTSCMVKCNYTPAFGPVVDDGYGMCYQPAPNKIRAGISAWRDCEETDAAKFRDTIVQCFRDMRTLLDSNSKL